MGQPGPARGRARVRDVRAAPREPARGSADWLPAGEPPARGRRSHRRLQRARPRAAADHAARAGARGARQDHREMGRATEGRPRAARDGRLGVDGRRRGERGDQARSRQARRDRGALAVQVRGRRGPANLLHEPARDRAQGLHRPGPDRPHRRATRGAGHQDQRPVAHRRHAAVHGRARVVRRAQGELRSRPNQCRSAPDRRQERGPAQCQPRRTPELAPRRQRRPVVLGGAPLHHRLWPGRRPRSPQADG